MKLGHVAWASFVLACVVAAAVRAQQPTPMTDQERLAKAREVAQSMADRIRTELAAALRTGVVEAIGVCHTLSPELADQTSATSGFEVTRTAFKLRNPENAPDAWEAKVLEDFQRRAAEGAELSKLDHYEVVTTNEGDKLFRYMKAIPTQEMCLACHGTDVKQNVKAEIAKYYPEDKATGFKLGELRGAFSLVQLME